MFVKVNNENKDIMMHYIKKEPSINLFIIGDVEQFGLEVNFLDVYLQYNHDIITSCILRYYQNIIVYSDSNDFNEQEMVSLIQSFSYARISGKKSVIDKIVPYLDNVNKIDECYFCELNESNKLIDTHKNVKKANKEDVSRIYPLMIHVGFSAPSYIESNRRKIESEAGRIYYCEDDKGNVIASAATAIETSVSAIIGGVGTHLNYRQQGFASQIVSKLCFDLLSEKKKPCLFFSNPDAGKIYHRLGFVDIDKWTMIIF